MQKITMLQSPVRIRFLIAFLLQQSCSFAQNCPVPVIAKMNNGGPSCIFTFTNNKKIAVSGYNKQPGVYSGFDIFECGSDSVIEEQGEINTCIISQQKDTITVQELTTLAVGKNSETVEVPFFIRSYYYNNGKLCSNERLKKDIPMYTAEQIKEALSKYENTARKENTEEILHLAHRLFWAYVSGNDIAREYLINFEKKFGPFNGRFSGAIAEEWNDLMRTFNRYINLNANF